MERTSLVRSVAFAFLVMALAMTQACERNPGSAEPGARALDLGNETARINYSLGYQIGGDFKQQQVELDANAVVEGIADALSGSEPKMSQPEMHETLVALKRKIVAEKREEAAERERELLEEGKRFLGENAAKPGVVTTGSGLQYRIIEPGSRRRPGPDDSVTCRYTGSLVDGNEANSSGDEPVTFRLGSAIPGWTEGLQLIGEGGKIELFIPQELAYRNSGPLAHQALVYEIELLSVGEK